MGTRCSFCCCSWKVKFLVYLCIMKKNNTHIVWRMSPNGCLTFILRILGIIAVIAIAIFVAIEEGYIG